ncbi:hypothetical protein AB0B45_44530 [Nonomuraea sp. NPDC049152]|uniref:STAS domain-containing protein n=1 Tax=Nonomuraea sp. NPDC049152 TaxID=3154350 RepID=UPI0033D355C7
MEHTQQGFTLQVSISDHGHCTMVSARGVLDRVSEPVFMAHVDAAWLWSDGPALILDAGGVTFCDFEGVGAFAAIARRLSTFSAAGVGQLLTTSGPASAPTLRPWAGPFPSSLDIPGAARTPGTHGGGCGGIGCGAG